MDVVGVEAGAIAYPSLRAYHAHLPDGWGTASHCLVAERVVDAFRERGVFDDLRALPDPLASVACASAPMDGWVPEVVYVGLFLATRDALFHDASDRLFSEWWLQIGKERVDAETSAEVQPSDPRGALERAVALWEANHRGTWLECSVVESTRGALRLHHPPGLFPRVMLEVYAKSIALLLVREDAAAPKVSVVQDPVARPGTVVEAITTFEAAWR